ncbi:MAG: hypothetical protein EOP50_11645, partial [Sphingobacteriales bacterium]
MHPSLSLTLKIDEPCSESWDAMQEAGGGRYCAQCEKTVVDFTGFTDAQLLDFFNKHTGSICGRIRQNNLRIEPVFVQPIGKRQHTLAPLAATLLTISTLTAYGGTPAASLFATPTTQGTG